VALSWLLEGLLMLLAATVLLLGVRWLVALANGEDPRDAALITGRWTAGLLGAAGAAGALGLVQLADIVGMVTMFVGNHPFAVSNGLVAGLGAFVADGSLALSSGQFLGIAVAIAGVVMLFSEVSSA
jgi:hypothetical protein